MSDLSHIKTRLFVLRGRIATALALDGSARLAATMLAVIAVSFGLDRLFRLEVAARAVLLVAALAWGVDLQEQPQIGILILGILAILGFSIPAYVLLGRIRPYPPPPDAAYVRSTLLVPEDIQGLETAFEFRNQSYAELFHAANEAATLGKLTQVKDRTLH